MILNECAILVLVSFRIPGSSVKDVPLCMGEDRLQIGFVEVGCKPAKKRGALKNKRELFYKFWSDTYRGVVDWFPRVYRMLAHYQPGVDPPLDIRKFELDTVVHYARLTPMMLEDLDDRDVGRIAQCIPKHERKHLERIIADRDAELLHDAIVHHDVYEAWPQLRGRVAESLVLKDMRRLLVPGMSLFENSYVRYFNQRFRNGTEIDGVLTLYQSSQYEELVRRFALLEYCVVRNRNILKNGVPVDT